MRYGRTSSSTRSTLAAVKSRTAPPATAGAADAPTGAAAAASKGLLTGVSFIAAPAMRDGRSDGAIGAKTAERTASAQDSAPAPLPSGVRPSLRIHSRFVISMAFRSGEAKLNNWTEATRSGIVAKCARSESATFREVPTNCVSPAESVMQ
eukprot:scaffold20418_cov112-Isochrysis_galbana.AAC.7